MKYLSLIISTVLAVSIVIGTIGIEEVSAQDFTDTNLDVPNLFGGTSDWGDYDNDGDLDLLVSGAEPTLGQYIQLFRNDSGNLTPVNSPFTGVSSGSVRWGDYNNDGFLDILIIGYVSVNGIMRVYENDGDGGFFDIGAEFPNLFRGTAEWGDYDGDGDLDIASVFDEYGPGRGTAIFRNDGDGNFSRLQSNLRAVNRGSIDMGDYDGDGDLDILLTGENDDFEFMTTVYRNDGNDSFSDIGFQFYPVVDGNAVWGDYDSDGDLDILFSGTDDLSRVVIGIYRNDGDDEFVYIEVENLGIGVGTFAAWGDFDNDGDLDFLANGAFLSKTVLFRNEGGDEFTRIENILANGCCGSEDWGDFDGDGDLDLLLNGIGIDPARLYRNEEPMSNDPPSEPGQLQSIIDGNNVTLSWEPSSDDRTPSPGLTYNIRLGTQPGGFDLISPMADQETGFRRVAGFGNAGHNLTKTIDNLPDGIYFWTVQSVDNSFKGSSFAPEEIFIVSQTGVDEDMGPITEFEIKGIYPNPFNSSTTFKYYLPEDSQVEVSVYDLLGKRIVVLENGFRRAGDHNLTWDAADYSSGVYIVRINGGGISKSARVSLIK